MTRRPYPARPVGRDGFMGDNGPFSYYNVIRGMTVFGAIGSVILIWSLTPWFPWK